MTNFRTSTANPYIVNHLRQLIYYHLDCNNLRNALFFAGRLHAYEPRSSEAAYLLGLCHLRLGQNKAAYDYSRSAGSRGTHLGCAYVFGQACLALEKYVEGAAALERCRPMWSGRNNWGKHYETKRQHLPDAAAVCCLKGKLWQAHSEHNKAIECYSESLKANPFMWDAFTGLCDLGVIARTANIFKITPEISNLVTSPFLEDLGPSGGDENSMSNTAASSHNNVTGANHQSSGNDPFTVSKNRVNGDLRGTSALFEKFNGAKNIVTPILVGKTNPGVDETPTNGGIMDPEFWSVRAPGNEQESITVEPPNAPARKGRNAPISTADADTEAPPKMNAGAAMQSKSRSKANSEEKDARSIGPVSSVSDLKRTISGKTPAASSLTTRTEPNSAVNDPGAPQRRSVRLFNQIRPQSGRLGGGSSIGAKEGRELRKVKAPGTKGRSANALNVSRIVSGNRKMTDVMDVDSKEIKTIAAPSAQATVAKPVGEKIKALEGLQSLLDLISKLGTGYFALSHYRCQEALRCFNSIPISHRETPWVLSHIGRAYYEQSSYVEAEKVFARLKHIAPSRLDDVEVYSTTLWHLKNDVDLAFLAHEATELDRNSPQAWCAVGNSFSLQRDHDQALKCFKRATQLDPNFAYAYTLQGHEHISNEEYDKAMQAYRLSISADKRHYNAWYGLGRVFERQGKHAFAEQHYRTAASINPTNAVLYTCIGSVLEKMKNPRGALVQYSRACDLAEKSTLCRYHKAKVLMALHDPERSLQELKVLKDLAPDEASVHFLLGRVYKALRQKPNAIRHFTQALNLDPKVSQCPGPWPQCHKSIKAQRPPAYGISLTRYKFAGIKLHQRSNGAIGR